MSQEPQSSALDPSWVRRSFDRAAATFDAAAVLHAEVRGHLLKRLDLTDLAPGVIVDAGAGTGHASLALARRYPKSRVIAIDLSPGMLRAASRRRFWRLPFARVCADAERLPLADGSVDLILSNFMLQWCDPQFVFGEFRRVLAPRGFLSFTSLGPDTLQELRAAWQQVDSQQRVQRFLDMHDVGDALVRAGFAAPVLDVERYTLTYTDVRRLAVDLKAAGSRNAMTGRFKALTGPRRFAALETAYEAYRHEGRLPATYEVVYGQAWAPVAAPRRHGTEDSISLQEVERQLRIRSTVR
jgi:malonyl-CoA O-methyltransferase